jgi:hypothetical protein
VATRRLRGRALVSLTIVIEGGSRRSAPVEKKGFVQLFATVVPGGSPRVKLAGGRSQAMNAFLVEIREGNEAVLLIDSEGPVDDEAHPTSHAYLVATAASHGVPGIAEAPVDDVHLMVQVMESWFFADPAGVAQRVKQLEVTKLEDALRHRNGNLELIPKDDAHRVFVGACGTKYEKVVHLEFIGHLDPGKIEAASTRAAALFRRLRGEEVWP